MGRTLMPLPKEKGPGGLPPGPFSKGGFPAATHPWNARAAQRLSSCAVRSEVHSWAMEALTANADRREEFFSPGTAYFVPPLPPSELDFAGWLAERTPAGAETLTVTTPGAETPIRLPRIRLAVESPSSFFGRRR